MITEVLDANTHIHFENVYGFIVFVIAGGLESNAPYTLFDKIESA